MSSMQFLTLGEFNSWPPRLTVQLCGVASTATECELSGDFSLKSNEAYIETRQYHAYNLITGPFYVFVHCWMRCTDINDILLY